MADLPSPTRAPGTAFFDLDGTLAQGTIVDHLLFLAVREPTLPDKIRRLGLLARGGPRLARLESLDRRGFNEAFYRCFEGMTRDRLEVLGGDLARHLIDRRLYRGARQLVAAEVARGRRVVLLTGALDVIARPFGAALGLEVASNQLGFEGGRCTGELVPPVLAGPGKVAWMRGYAARHGEDLGAASAYADDAADLPMLSAVGEPVAVNPDAGLAATATSHGWRTVSLGAPRGGGLLERALDASLALFGDIEDRIR